ncbi:unnamed protein product [Gadus morhua 'NCC']
MRELLQNEEWFRYEPLRSPHYTSSAVPQRTGAPPTWRRGPMACLRGPEPRPPGPVGQWRASEDRSPAHLTAWANGVPQRTGALPIWPRGQMACLRGPEPRPPDSVGQWRVSEDRSPAHLTVWANGVPVHRSVARDSLQRLKL